MRRNPNSFNMATEAIRMLTEEKEIVWDIVTYVNPQNYNDLDSFKEDLSKKSTTGCIINKP